MLVAENREHALRALLRQRQVIHEHPDEHERQGRRHGPEVADVLHVHHAIRRLDARAEERGEVPAEEQRCRQVDQRDAEVADTGVDAEREAFVRLREEEADVGHRSGEVGAGDADEGDEQHERVVRRRRVLQRAAEAEERQEQQGRRDEGRVAAANQARQVRVEEAARRADEARQRCKREELFIGEVEAHHVELRRNRCPERPDDEGQHECPCRGVEVLLCDLLLYGKKGALYSTLIRLANSYGKETDGGILISVPLTNQELANYSATARESLNRMLSELRKNGIIEYRGHLIFIKDIDYLKEAIQCENCGREICNIE